jgi:hypothetical protein
MRATWSLAAFALLLAGCTSPAATPAGTGTSTAASTTTGGIRVTCVDQDIRPVANGTCAQRPAPTRIALDWDGKLGTVVNPCLPHPVECVPTEMDSSSEHSEKLPAGNLTSAHVELSWTSTTPATQTLTLGVMVMGCPGCGAPFSKEVSGASPLVVDASDLQVPVNASQVLHVYVYNPALAQGADPVFLYATPDQAFTVKGSAIVMASQPKH